MFSRKTELVQNTSKSKGNMTLPLSLILPQVEETGFSLQTRISHSKLTLVPERKKHQLSLSEEEQKSNTSGRN